jgi:hypothetical protein
VTLSEMTNAPEHPRCPFAARHGDGMHRCPGFEAAVVSGVTAPWEPELLVLGETVTCLNLCSQRGGRGFISACTRPGGLPSGALALAGARLS